MSLKLEIISRPDVKYNFTEAWQAKRSHKGRREAWEGGTTNFWNFGAWSWEGFEEQPCFPVYGGKIRKRSWVEKRLLLLRMTIKDLIDGKHYALLENIECCDPLEGMDTRFGCMCLGGALMPALITTEEERVYGWNKRFQWWESNSECSCSVLRKKAWA